MLIVFNAEQMWKLWPEERLLDWYEGKAETARNCVECGTCEEACPYQLPIRDMLKTGVEFLEARMN